MAFMLLSRNLTFSHAHACTTVALLIPAPLADLAAGNTLRLIVHSETDGDYIVQRESGFSAYRLPATEGMFGNIQATYETTGVGWHEVGCGMRVPKSQAIEA